MTIDVASLQHFSDADLLQIVRVAIAEICQYGQLRTVRNKTIQTATLAELRALEADLSSRVSAAARGRVRNYARRKRS